MATYISEFRFESPVDGTAMLYEVNKEVITPILSERVPVSIGKNVIRINPSKMITGNVQLSVVVNMSASKPITVSVLSGSAKV
jgi:hypothetical protein